jgi:hypothetical protein
VLLTLLILLTLSLPAIGLVVRIVGREKELGSWFLPMLALAGLIAAVGPGDDLNLYGLQIASGIGVLILTARVLESWTGERAPGSWRAVAILLVALILGRVDLAVGSTTAIRWWAMTRPVILLAAMILAVTLIMMTDRSRRRRLCPSDLLACAIIAAALATYPHPPSWRFTDGSSQWREIEASLQQTDRVALREFVGRVVPRDGILVTVDRIELADARRRQLFAIGGGPQFIPARLTLQDSLRSAIGRGDCRELARAVSRGGTHLVLARDQSALISSCFTRVYENASYVVYDLAKAP